MLEKQITVKISSGLDSRPVAMLVQLASQFQSNIYMILNNKKVNAKSIMGMMSIGAIEGEDIIVTAEGVDEQEALQRIENYLSEIE